MWTATTRREYERKTPRYLSDLTDGEWALVAPLIPPARRGGRKREVDVREVMNGVLYVLETGCQWRVAQRPAAQVHGARLFHAVGVRPHAGAPAPRALCNDPRPRRPRGLSRCGRDR